MVKHLHLSLLILTICPLHCIFLECMVLKMYGLMINFRTMIGLLLVLTRSMLIPKKPLIEVKESRSPRFLSGNHRGHSEHECDSLHQVSCNNNQKCPHHPTRGNEGGGGRGPYSPPRGNGYYPDLPLADILLIMVLQVEVVAAIQMIHTVQVQKAPCLLSQSRGIGKTDKIGMSSQVNLKKSVVAMKNSL